MKKKNSIHTIEEYKFAVVGVGGVGKSAITVQFIQNIFVEEYDPTIEDCYRKQINFGDEILDTAGQEEFKVLRDQYMRIGDGFLLVYSIVDPDSLHAIMGFYQHLLRVKYDCHEIPMVLVGNKLDLEDDRRVSVQEGQQMAKKLGGIPFFEVSAKSRKNVDECFLCLTKEVRNSVLKKNVNNKKRRRCSLF